MKRISMTLALVMVTVLVSGVLGWKYAEARERRLLWEWVHPVVVEAGHPNKCNDGQGPPCARESCKAMGPDGNPLPGHWCGLKCSRKCCGCPTVCNGHNPERPAQPQEEQ